MALLLLSPVIRLHLDHLVPCPIYSQCSVLPLLKPTRQKKYFRLWRNQKNGSRKVPVCPDPCNASHFHGGHGRRGRLPVPPRQRVIWIWEPQELPMWRAVQQEVRPDTVQEAVPFLLQQVLRQVPVRPSWLLRQQAGLPLLQQLEDQARRPQVPLKIIPLHCSFPSLGRSPLLQYDALLIVYFK